MKFKSLVILCVIAVAGTISGIYLMSEELRESWLIDRNTLRIITDKTEYKMGEEINFRFINHGNTNAHFGNTALGIKITNSSDYTVWAFGGGDMTTHLRPNEDSREFTWKQIDDIGLDQVPPGTYKIFSRYHPDVVATVIIS